MIDLHTHSTASDGTMSPSELIRYASSRKISVIALTDHDTTSGLKEACQEAAKQGITFVPGIEITVNWPTGEFHLLGLGLTHSSQELKDTLLNLRQERKNRNRKMAEKLQENGVDISYEEVYERYGTENIGRPHFASVMAEKGIVRHRQQAFDVYFASGRPCYIPRGGVDLDKAVQGIKTSGGIPVQAHPLSMYISWGKMDDAIRDVKASGVEGLEAWHSAVRVGQAQRLEKLARSLGMIVTGGSDFHGERVRADRHIGYTAGNKPIEDRFWTEELKPLLDKTHGTDVLTYEE
ncbi:MAG: PHP domain-containing protein, partial [Treponema sp.]|nr:PHP domain-containing protein [Treponema sp.]